MYLFKQFFVRFTFNGMVFFFFFQVNQLAVIGGADMKEAVGNTMCAVLAHEVAIQFNLTGKHGWKAHEKKAKLPFCSLNICAVIKRKLIFINKHVHLIYVKLLSTGGCCQVVDIVANYEHVGYVAEAVVRRYKDAATSQIEKYIGIWLRGACDRKGGRKRRERQPKGGDNQDHQDVAPASPMQ